MGKKSVCLGRGNGMANGSAAGSHLLKNGKKVTWLTNSVHESCEMRGSVGVNMYMQLIQGFWGHEMDFNSESDMIGFMFQGVLLKAKCAPLH